MALTESRIIKQITHLPQSNTVQVQWANVISRDGEVLTETYERKAYGPEQKDEFAAEVEGSAAYLSLLGW